VPAYPASHGCVRMPAKFAKTLYGMTRRGFHVVITDEQVVPMAIRHPLLFVPQAEEPKSDLMSDADLRPAVDSPDVSVELAMAEVVLPKAGAMAVAEVPKPLTPVKILITRAPASVLLQDIQSVLNQLGYDAGPEDGKLTRKTSAAIRAYQSLHGQAESGTVTAPLASSIYKVVRRAPPANGRLYVRRDFKDVLQAPVVIVAAERPLGTHFFTASHVDASTHSADWFAISLANPLPEKTRARIGITEPDPVVADSATAVLDRLTIDEATHQAIDAMMASGSSMTVTDLYSPEETGLGTDFITLLNKAR
jgi:peptidoglycan hydrolase-like protein with peptidoglycan-binding domain